MLNSTASLGDALLRHFIGLNQSHLLERETNYPPFNIEQLDDDHFVLSLAVAGFNETEIDISLLNGVLTINGEKPETETKSVYLHRGLGFRDFVRTFTIAEHIQVLSAELRNGMLTIFLERQIPESAKPKRIAISTIAD